MRRVKTVKMRTRHARRERPAMAVGNAFLSPLTIGRVIYKFTQPVRRMYRVERKFLRK